MAKKNADKDEIIYARIPGALRKALERERVRRSRAGGAEVQTSSVIRAILEETLLRKKKAA